MFVEAVFNGSEDAQPRDREDRTSCLWRFSLVLPLALVHDARARRAAPARARNGRARDAPIDLTGQWVAIISEDWRWRMITPPKGDIVSIPLNLQGQHVAEAWDPAKDEAAGEQCKAYGAPGLMRGPIRMRISWQDDNTLKVETDYGMQTRLLRFGDAPRPAGAAQLAGRPRRRNGSCAAAAAAQPAVRHAEDRDDESAAGYLRKNGVPYSERAVFTEYWDVHTLPNGDKYCWSTRTWSKTRSTSSCRSRRRSTTSSNATPASGIRRHATRDSEVQRIRRWRFR